MSQEVSNLAEVATRAVLDPVFRAALVENVDQTLAIAQLPLSAEEIAALQAMNLAEWDDLSLHAVQDRIGAGAAGLGISVSLKQITIQ
jgi:hypothetical protein